MFHSNKIAGSPSSVKVVTYTEQESNQEYKEQISQLERQVEQKKKELEICMEANRSENLIEMKKLKRELISLNDQTEDRQNQLNMKTQQVKVLHEKNQNMLDEIRKLETEKDCLEKRKRKIAEQDRNLNDKLNSATQKQNQLRQEAEQKNKENKRKQQQILKLKSQTKILENKLQAAKKEQQQAKLQHLKKQQQNKKTMREDSLILNGLNKEIQEMKRVNRQLKQLPVNQCDNLMEALEDEIAKNINENKKIQNLFAMLQDIQQACNAKVKQLHEIQLMEKSISKDLECQKILNKNKQQQLRKIDSNKEAQSENLKSLYSNSQKAFEQLGLINNLKSSRY